MVLEDRAVIRRDGEFPFYSFKPSPHRYGINRIVGLGGPA